METKMERITSSFSDFARFLECVLPPVRICTPRGQGIGSATSAPKCDISFLATTRLGDGAFSADAIKFSGVIALRQNFRSLFSRADMQIALLSSHFAKAAVHIHLLNY
jgi:hypothetical protein